MNKAQTMPAVRVDRRALSREEAAQALTISTRTLDRLIRAGRLAIVKVGARVLVPTSEVDRFLGSGAA